MNNQQLNYYNGLSDERKAEWLQSTEKVDPALFAPMTAADVLKVLGLTIKRDETNKLITFLALLSTYTEDSQLNISFNAPSSSGKSFIPTEIASLFPIDDVKEVGYCSPTAFFHDVGVFDKAKEGYMVDLSRKILIFLDQPHTLLLQHLRPLLSHDKKEIRLKITDKSQRAGLRTKNIFLIGYPTVIFCTAGLSVDEQEATRFLLLSPETHQEKLREAIHEKIKRESDKLHYKSDLDSHPERLLLMRRIFEIRQAHIKDIRIVNTDNIEKRFFEHTTVLKPRHQRDIGRIINLSKIFALLNYWWRDNDGETIIANTDDINNAFAIWDVISESQELNLPPYVYNLYKDVILAAFQEKNDGNEGGQGQGLTRKDIIKKHFQVYGRHIPDWQLRQDLLPMLESAGLIFSEQDSRDKRQILIYPTTGLTISHEKNNSEPDGGVEATNTCFICGGTEFWKRQDGESLCVVCHPPTN